MNAVPGIFHSEGTPEGRGLQRYKLTAGRTVRSCYCALRKRSLAVGQQWNCTLRKFGHYGLK